VRTYLRYQSIFLLRRKNKYELPLSKKAEGNNNAWLFFLLSACLLLSISWKLLGSFFLYKSVVVVVAVSSPKNISRTLYSSV
jgi:Na+-transporting NADH:ubiquinone oxidoreductase subunit NqrE